MVKKKDTEEKVTAASRKITVTGVAIEDGMLVDEDGNVANRIAEHLPKGIDIFDMTIKFNLPVEEDDEVDADEFAPDEDAE